MHNSCEIKVHFPGSTQEPPAGVTWPRLGPRSRTVSNEPPADLHAECGARGLPAPHTLAPGPQAARTPEEVPGEEHLRTDPPPPVAGWGPRGGGPRDWRLPPHCPERQSPRPWPALSAPSRSSGLQQVNGLQRKDVRLHWQNASRLFAMQCNQ